MSEPPTNPPPMDSSQPTNPAEEIPIVQISPIQPSLYEKVVQILNAGDICLECLGRQFSYLGTNTDNTTRASSLLLCLSMDCDLILSRTTSLQRYTLFNKSPLEIIELMAKSVNFEPAIRLLFSYIDDRIDLFTIENKLTLLDQLKPLASKSNPKRKVIFNTEFKCPLCENNLLPESIEKIAKKVVEAAKPFEFVSYLVGTNVPPVIANREEEFRAHFELQNGESFKANMNRLVGKQLNAIWRKPVDFKEPDIVYLVNLNTPELSIDCNSNALYVKGIYLKFVRNLPQTKWDCYDCHGSKINSRTQQPCETCHGTGRIYDTSIEEILGPYVVSASEGTDFVFHGAGREDFDVRCLGKGRPFILEIKNPKKRKLDLETIRQKINSDHSAEIELISFKPAEKADVVIYKNMASEGVKVYNALITTADFIDEETFNQKFKLLQETYAKRKVAQRTPKRVVRRRADMTRQKKILSVEGNYIDSVHFFARIKADSGTYIKELISGDDGRTYPSFASIFDMALMCVELDVVEIEDAPGSNSK